MLRQPLLSPTIATGEQVRRPAAHIKQCDKKDISTFFAVIAIT
jgi:hypothetical protein